MRPKERRSLWVSFIRTGELRPPTQHVLVVDVCSEMAQQRGRRWGACTLDRDCSYAALGARRHQRCV